MRNKILYIILISCSIFGARSLYSQKDSLINLLKSSKVHDTSKITLISSLIPFLTDVEERTKYLNWDLEILSEQDNRLDKKQKNYLKSIIAFAYVQEIVLLDFHLQKEIIDDRADKVLNLFKDAKENFELQTQCRALNDLAVSLQRIGYIERAFKIYDNALSVGKSIDYKKGIADTYSYSGMLYRELGNMNKAFEYYYKALDIREKNNIEEDLGNSFNNLASLFFYEKNYAKSVDFFNKTITSYEKYNDWEGLTTAYSNLGIVYLNLKQFDKALQSLYKAIDIANKQKLIRSNSRLYTYLGNMYTQMNKLDSADFYLKKAYQMNLEQHNQRGKLATLNNMANLEFKKGNLQKALELGEEYYNENKKIGLIFSMKDAALFLSKVYLSLGKHVEALNYRKMHFLLRDSINSEESKKTSMKQQLEYDHEKELLIIRENSIVAAAKHMEQSKSQSNFLRISLFGFAGFIGLFILLFYRFKITNKQRKIIVHQQEIIQLKNEAIHDSIEYAQRIQHSLLPELSCFDKIGKERFIIFKPKDIVSGDFFWTHEINEDIQLFAIADCTGHGVPGAFMSALGLSALNSIVGTNENISPDKIMKKLKTRIETQLNSNDVNDHSGDGMELTLCKLDKKEGSLTFSGSKLSVYQIRNNVLTEYKTNKIPIGKGTGLEDKFTCQEIKIEKGDMYYFSTDGFQDQKNGQDGQKLMTKRVKDKFVEISNFECSKQHLEIETLIHQWKGTAVQTDDILVFGFKV